MNILETMLFILVHAVFIAAALAIVASPAIVLWVVLKRRHARRSGRP